MSPVLESECDYTLLSKRRNNSMSLIEGPSPGAEHNRSRGKWVDHDRPCHPYGATKRDSHQIGRSIGICAVGGLH